MLLKGADIDSRVRAHLGRPVDAPHHPWLAARVKVFRTGTPLGIAVEAGHLAVVEVLWAAGPDITPRFREEYVSAFGLTASGDYVSREN